MSADLHLHSTVSDGILTPGELVRLAAGMGLRIIALTDHDSTDGISEAAEVAREFPGLTLISGIELSADIPWGEVHILGYFKDSADEELQETLSSFREGRVGRAWRMVEKLSELGMPLAWDRVQHLAGEGSIGRPHVAQAMLERGYVATVKEAFDWYIGRNGPAYSGRVKLKPVEAIGLVRRAGGLASLAHPLEGNDVTPLLPELVEAGLAGMESYYGLYPAETRQRLLNLCNRYGILPTGGSDYHGPGLAAECPLGDAKVPLEVGEAILAHL